MGSCCSVGRSNFQISKETLNQTKLESNGGPIKYSEKMVFIPGGEFFMGTDDHEGFPSDGEGPVRLVSVDPFYMDSHTVSNAEFKQFIKETGYITDAEKYGWSFVFHKFINFNQLNQIQQVRGTPWWFAVPEANWYQPAGIGSSIEDQMDHPVIHVSWNDAVAFSKWAGKRLPTEAEWEYAARGGLEQKKYPWGDELTPGGEHYCNIWQGNFPQENTEEDGFLGTAPVKSFPPNGFGLYNIVGNVWEWCSDWFTSHPDSEINPRLINDQTPKVMRGGSYLCHKSYCNRYRVAARSSNTIDTSTGNLGFRCVLDA